MNKDIGQNIILSIRILRNNSIRTGLTVNVRVTDALDGSEKLASTLVPETAELGVYSFEWTTPPQAISELIAFYKVGSLEYSESISILPKSGGGGDSVNVNISDDDNFNIELSEDSLDINIIDNDNLNIAMDEDSIGINFDEDEINIEIS